MPQSVTKVGHFGYGDYRRWPHDECGEVIDGDAYAMTPAPSRLHQAFAVELTRQIANQRGPRPDPQARALRAT